MTVKLDLVIPVHNALRATRDCLRTARAHAPAWARIVVVNDSSDARTTEWLRAQEGITLLENPVNLGFVKSANRGLLFSDAPYVCLLNSDTLLTPGALERMVERLDREPGIGMCCPLSNSAVNLSVADPAGRGRLLVRAPGRPSQPGPLSRRHHGGRLLPAGEARAHPDPRRLRRGLRPRLLRGDRLPLPRPRRRLALRGRRRHLRLPSPGRELFRHRRALRRRTASS